MSQNPYHTPSIEYQSDRSPSPLFVLARSLGQAVISVGLTILFWLTFALIFGLLVPSLNSNMIVAVWSISLFISMGTSTTLVTYAWKSRTSPLTFSLVYATFAIMFYIFVLLPSVDFKRLDALVEIATLAALPVTSSAIVWSIRRLDKLAIAPTLEEYPR